MRLGTGRLPPSDGESKFRYPQGAVMLRADDKEKLIQVIFQYRLNNNIPIGDVDGDVDRFYCNRWPKFCHADASDVPAQFQTPMLGRVTNWVAGLRQQMPKGGFALVTSAEAETRAGICMNCKFNVPWKGGCGACAASTLAALQQVKQLRRTKRDGNLSACAITSWENGAAVHLPVDALEATDEQKARMPEGCWRKIL